MNHYIMQWFGGSQWEYQFTQPSDEMAIEFAKRHAAQIDSSRCQALLLAQVEPQRMVAKINIRQAAPVPVVTVERLT